MTTKDLKNYVLQDVVFRITEIMWTLDLFRQEIEVVAFLELSLYLSFETNFTRAN